MQKVQAPELTPLLQPDWDSNESLQVWHEQLQAHSITSYAQTPIGSLTMSGQRTGQGIRYVDIIPPEVANEKEAIFIMHNFAGGWGVRGALRHEALLATLPEPRRLIAFPNTVAGEEVASYSRQERRQMASGNFNPLAERVLQTCRELGVTSLQTAGYSQGAATGAAVLARAHDHDIATSHSGLFDPPNIVDRAPHELMRDFVATGVANGFYAARAANIPAINEANGDVLLTRAINRVQAIRSYVHPHNRAIARGMTWRTFGRDANRFLAASPEAQLLCMRAEHSTVTPRTGYEKQIRFMSHYADRVTSIEIPDIGHEFAENPISYALLAARALYPKGC